jgi:hypothetical protein
VLNSWLDGLIAKHRDTGILLDSNLLFVYCVGLLEPSLIGKEKGTREYESRDFQLLYDIVGAFDHILTTPNVLTEVSNLAGRLREDIRLLFRLFIRENLLTILDERYVISEDAAKHSVFAPLGLTDAVVSILAERGMLVVTNDLNLRVMLESFKFDCVHYDRDLRPLVLNSE